MNVSPLIYFAMRHGRQIADLVGSSEKPRDHLLLDLAKTLAPWLKRWFPWINDQNLLDDAIDTLDNTFSDNPQTVSHCPGYPDPTQS
jgi:hypothetical protein